MVHDASAPDPLIGRNLAGRYAISRKLGAGGMGAVYLATQQAMGRQVAIKVLDPKVAQDPAAVQRFHAEAQVVANINHPNIVTVFDFGQDDDGLVYLAMELLEGVTLRDLLKERKALTWLEAMPTILGIVNALAEAHSAGIVHRDLKPDNVMLVGTKSGDRLVKVLDFGLAKAVSQGAAPVEITAQNALVGTPAYLSPEQIQGEHTDGRADLYALGILWWETLVGRRPIVGNSFVETLMRHLTVEIPPPSRERPDAEIPPEGDALILRLVAKDRKRRPDDARALLDLVAPFDVRELSGKSTRGPRSREGPPASIQDLVAPPRGSEHRPSTSPGAVLPAVRAPSPIAAPALLPASTTTAQDTGTSASPTTTPHTPSLAQVLAPRSLPSSPAAQVLHIGRRSPSRAEIEDAARDLSTPANKRPSTVVIAAAIGGLLAAAAGIALFVVGDQAAAPVTDVVVDPLAALRKQWATELGTVGDPAARIAEGERLLDVDESFAARQRADRAFAAALLGEPESDIALASWAENAALRGDAADPAVLATALVAVDAALQRSADQPRLLRARGALLTALGDLEAATGALERAAVAAPDDGAVRRLLAEALLDADPERALSLANGARVFLPRSTTTARTLGAIERRTGGFEKARLLLEERAKAEPLDVDAQIELALLDADEGAVARGLERLDAVSSQAPGVARAKTVAGEIAYQLGADPKRANAVLSEIAARAGPLRARAEAHAIHARLAQGKAALALPVVDDAAARGDASPALAYAAARAHLAVRDATKVPADLARAQAKDARSRAALALVRGDALLVGGAPTEAITAYDQVGDVEPYAARARVGRYAAAALTGDVRVLEQAEHTLLLADLRGARDRAGLLDAPVTARDATDLVSVLAAAPDTVGKGGIDVAMGLLLFEAGQDQAARSRIEKAPKQKGTGAVATALLAALDVEAGDGELALKRLAGLPPLTRDLVGPALLFAKARAATGDRDGARAALAAVPPKWAARAMVEARLALADGRRNEALQLARKAATLDPHYTPPRAFLLEQRAASASHQKTKGAPAAASAAKPRAKGKAR